MRNFFLALIVGVALATFVVEPVAAQSRTLTTATGYQLEYVVRGEDASEPVALVIMHGKNTAAGTVLSRLSRWAESVAGQGFRVYVPVMPWSDRWDGSFEDAVAAVDALVDLAAKDGKKVVVGGHSMGAMFALVYRASSPPPAVVGKFASAPGHMLDMIPSNSNFWSDLNPSIERARSLEQAGKGKERVQFGGRNTTGSKNITESYEMTPEVYLSWHDPKRLPGSAGALKVTTLPVLWTVGSNDPLARSSASQSVFNLMPGHPKSSFVPLGGKDHSSSFGASTEKLVPWMRALAPQ